jgi:hypothetical protein
MSLFIDAHCHPTLKHYLFGYSVFRGSRGQKDNNYTNIQVTQPAMRFAGVDAVMSAHYLPEKYLVSDWNLVQDGFPVLQVFLNKYKQST